jgi:hypothetical protein
MPSYHDIYWKARPFLQALADIESGNNPKAIGKKGEVSAYQILPKVWTTIAPLTKLSVRNIEDHQIAGRVAYKLLWDNHKKFLEITGTKPSPQDLYIMWNRGFNFYKRNGFRVDPIKYKKLVDAAQRYDTLVNKYNRNRF